jgi:catechol 2,3-dioxygenase-like lactoylglutathione lyase family enzyme
MAAAIHVVTLAVTDLQRSLAFYRDGLGLSTEGVIGTEFVGDESTPAGAVAMFTLSGGLILSLYPRSELTKDSGTAIASGGSAMSLGHTVDSRGDVDRVLQLAVRAGGTALGEPHERPWGIYSGYFTDPDEHLWEVVYFLPRG